MSNALFAPSSRSLSRNMVEIKAGKMKLEDTIMSADTRKGLIYIYQSDDSLIHFCWRDRTSGNVEEDLIIFPDDCEFQRIPECKTGRVYVLKFKSSTRRLYFWMQDLKTDKDDENCRLVNDTLNNPPTSGRSSSSSGDGELHSLLNNMSQQQLIQLFGNVGAGNIGSLTSLLSGARSPSSRSSKSPKTSSASSSSSSTPKESKSEAPATTPELENWFKKYNVPETKPDGSRQPLNLTGKVNANILTALFKNPSSLSELYNLIWNPNLPSKDKLISSTYIRVLTMLHKCSETGELQLEKLKNVDVTPELVSAANERELMTFMSLIYTNPAYGGAGDASGDASGIKTKDVKQEGEPEDKKGKE